MTWEEVGAVALALPGVEASTSYGTPAFKVKKALLVRLKEDGASVVLSVGLDEKEMLLEAASEIFFQTPHYAGYPAILARLETLTGAELTPILQRTWRAKAPRSLQRDIPIPRPRGDRSGSRSRRPDGQLKPNLPPGLALRPDQGAAEPAAQDRADR